MCLKHGVSHYRSCKCRCPICREANTIRTRDENAKRRQHTRENNGIAVDAATHGAATYTNWRCRCDTCIHAHRAKERTYYYARLGREVPADV